MAIYMRVCVSLYLFVCLYAYIYTYIHYIHTYGHIYACVCACVCVYQYQGMMVLWLYFFVFCNKKESLRTTASSKVNHQSQKQITDGGFIISNRYCIAVIDANVNNDVDNDDGNDVSISDVVNLDLGSRNQGTLTEGEGSVQLASSLS